MIPRCCFHGILQCTVNNTEFGVIHTFVTHTSEQNIYCTLYYIYSVYTHNIVCRTLTSQQDPLLIVGLYNFHCKHIFATFPLSLNEHLCDHLSFTTQSWIIFENIDILLVWIQCFNCGLICQISKSNVFISEGQGKTKEKDKTQTSCCWMPLTVSAR